MKKAVFFALLALLMVPAMSVWATDEVIPTTPLVTSEVVVASATENTPSSIDNAKSAVSLRSLGSAQIKSRVNKLTTLLNKVGRSNLTTDQKTVLKTDLDTNINNLKSTLEKITTEKEVTVLQVLVKSIYSDYRIVSIVLPRDNAQLAIFKQMNSLSKLSEHRFKLETKLNEWTTVGKDTSNLKLLLDSSKKHLDEADSVYAKTLAVFQALKPNDYPAKEKIEAARKDLNDGNKHLRSAHADLAKLSAQMRVFDSKVKFEERQKALKEKAEKNKKAAEEKRMKEKKK